MCCGVGLVRIRTGSGESAKVNVLVTWKDILGFDLLLGYDTIKALGRVLVTQAGTVQFLEAPVCVALCRSSWLQSGIWSTPRVNGQTMRCQLSYRTCVIEYPIPTNVRIAYKQELDAWIKDDWLIPDPNQKLGPPRSLIPLMAIVKQRKLKVRPVMDYHELNQYFEAYTANTDVCEGKLQEWHRKGSNVSLLDLRKAYL